VSRGKWAEVLETTEESCARLIADGGADYDGIDVHPGTVLDVLRGETGRGCGKVVPRGRGRSVLFGIYTHGWSHRTLGKKEQRAVEATVDCDLCGKPHKYDMGQEPGLEHIDDVDGNAGGGGVGGGGKGGESGEEGGGEEGKGWDPLDIGDSGAPNYDHDHSSLSTRQWFLHLPVEVPSNRETIYHGISHGQHPHHRSLLYWQHFAAAYEDMLRSAPARPIVALYNFCSSGGFLKYMDVSKRDHGHRSGEGGGSEVGVRRALMYGVPEDALIAVMASSGEQEGAIPGLMQIWMRRLGDILVAGGGGEGGGGGEEGGGVEGGGGRGGETLADMTMREMFDDVEKTYYEENPSLLEQTNEVCRIPQQTRDKRQETRDERRETRDRRSPLRPCTHVYIS
jgi:hypothetical protein